MFGKVYSPSGRVLNDLEVWAKQPPHVKQAFKRAAGSKVKLDEGMRLCKLSHFPTLAPPDTAKLSEWWSPFDAYMYDPGFDFRYLMAARFSVSIRELSRVVVAVKENWNSLSYLLVISLKQPVHAFFGDVAGQLRIDPGAGTKLRAGEERGAGGLAGNGVQFYIPGLTLDHATLVDSRCLL
jgi:hypothetical protein